MPIRAAIAIALPALALGACMQTSALLPPPSPEERDCLARAMYFESNRTSEDGMLAVGTVVMNRLQSAKYPKTVCAVVAQERQFAAGVMTKPTDGRGFDTARRMADAVLTGDRHDEVGAAMHFHTAGRTFPYRNMAYVSKAGGNVFYEKKEPGTFEPVKPHTLIAREDTARPSAPKEIRLASADLPAAPVARLGDEPERPLAGDGPAEEAVAGAPDRPAVPKPRQPAETRADRVPLPPIREARADAGQGATREASAAQD